MATIVPVIHSIVVLIMNFFGVWGSLTSAQEKYVKYFKPKEPSDSNWNSNSLEHALLDIIFHMGISENN